MSDIIDSNEILTFGKFKSRNIKDIIKEEPSYCQWLLERPDYLNETQVNILNKTIKRDDYYMSFGKYKNKSLKWIYDTDKKYIHYLKNNEYVKSKMNNLLDFLNTLGT
jgi:uncharacterized protein (DUF3820 family)